MTAGSGTTRAARRSSVSLDPMHIAPTLKSMTWPELDQLAHQIIVRMTLLAEAPGAPVGGAVSSGKPGSAPPRGDLALADEHREHLDRASQRCLLTPDEWPAAYAKAIVRAAVALATARGGGRAVSGDDPNEVTDRERIDWIIDTYEGYDPHYAAAIESARGGWITADAIRSARRANARHGETGLTVPVGDELKALVRREIAAGTSQRDIARRFDIGKGTVHRILSEEE
jgi:hypothetical protein